MPKFIIKGDFPKTSEFHQSARLYSALDRMIENVKMLRARHDVTLDIENYNRNGNKIRYEFASKDEGFTDFMKELKFCLRELDNVTVEFAISY